MTASASWSGIVCRGGLFWRPAGVSQRVVMPGQFSGSVVINRPIDDVFAFLAPGTNDPKFSPRVLEIRKEPDGPSGLGTVFVSRAAKPRPTSSGLGWPSSNPSKAHLCSGT